MSNAQTLAALPPMQRLEYVKAMAEMLGPSRYFKDATDKSRCAAKILYGMDLGLGPVQSLLGVDFNEKAGSLSLRAHTMAALIRASKRYDYEITKGPDEEGCEITYFRIEWDLSESAQPKRKAIAIGKSFFGPKEAKKAQLATKATYLQHTADMYYNRAMAKGARMHCPDVFGAPAYVEGEVEGTIPEYAEAEIQALEAKSKAEKKVKTGGTEAPVTAVKQETEAQTSPASSLGSEAVTQTVAPITSAGSSPAPDTNEGRITLDQLGLTPEQVPEDLRPEPSPDPVATATPEERATAQQIIAESEKLALAKADPTTGELSPASDDELAMSDVVPVKLAARIAQLPAGAVIDKVDLNDFHAYLVDFLGGGEGGKKAAKAAWAKAGVEVKQGVLVTREQAVQVAKLAPAALAAI